jgi:hypothetical protein
MEGRHAKPACEVSSQQAKQAEGMGWMGQTTDDPARHLPLDAKEVGRVVND